MKNLFLKTIYVNKTNMSLIAKQLLIHNIGLPKEISMLVNDYTFPRINKIPKNDRRYLKIRNIIVKHISYSPSRLDNFILPDGIDINEINYYVCVKCPRSQEREFDINLVQSFCLHLFSFKTPILNEYIINNSS
jgi:hypothetical protein